jgi:hypothetical protein
MIGEFASQRIALLREVVSSAENAGPAKRQEVSEIVAAANAPASITARLSRNKLTNGDIIVLKRLFPRQWADLQRQADEELRSNPKLAPARRRMLERIARDGQRKQTYQAAMTARKSVQEPSARPTRASIKLPSLATPLQRIEGQGRTS